MSNLLLQEAVRRAKFAPHNSVDPNFREHFYKLVSEVVSLSNKVEYLTDKVATLETDNATLREMSGIAGQLKKPKKYIAAGKYDTPIYEIIDTVAEEFKLTRNDILKKSARTEFITARAVAMWLASELSRKPRMHAARLFERDHSSLVTAERKIERLMAQDPDLRATVDALKVKLSRPSPDQPTATEVSFTLGSDRSEPLARNPTDGRETNVHEGRPSEAPQGI